MADEIANKISSRHNFRSTSRLSQVSCMRRACYRITAIVPGGLVWHESFFLTCQDHAIAHLESEHLATVISPKMERPRDFGRVRRLDTAVQKRVAGSPLFACAGWRYQSARASLSCAMLACCQHSSQALFCRNPCPRQTSSTFCFFRQLLRCWAHQGPPAFFSAIPHS